MPLPRAIFMSYSAKDGRQLAHAIAAGIEKAAAGGLKVWMFETDQRAGFAWDTQIRDAIAQSAFLLFLMTPDSVRDGSNCHDEWTLALKYRQVVMPLVGAIGVGTPFRLHERHRIDFTTDFPAAMSNLLAAIEWLLSPEGERRRLQDQLADARRALDGVSAADRGRIAEEVSRLEAEVVRLSTLADGVVGGSRGIEQIRAAIFREKELAAAPAAKREARIVNVPPVTPPSYFQNRFVEIGLLKELIRDPAIRMITIMGRSGLGKTALVCKLINALKAAGSVETDGIDAVVYFGERTARRARVANIHADLAKLLPPKKARALAALYANTSIGIEEKFHALLEALGQRRVVVLLDNLEDLINPGSRELVDRALHEALRTILAAPQSRITALITTQIPIRSLSLAFPERQRRLDIDKGLEPQYAEKILRSLDVDGRVGMRDASAERLAEAIARTSGVPRALEALFAILSADRETSLEELLRDTATVLPDHVLDVLVGEAYRRLDPADKAIMQVLAVFNRPVTSTAVDFVLQPFRPGVQSREQLVRLVNLHLVRADGDPVRFYLHPADRRFALGQLEHSSTTLPGFMRTPDRVSVYERAAQYFVELRVPEAQWMSIGSIQPILDEVELRIEAGDNEAAARTLALVDDRCLLSWGYFTEMLSLHRQLEHRLIDPYLVARNRACIGKMLSDLGPLDAAVDYLQHSLEACSAEGYEALRLDVMSNLASTLKELSRYGEALLLHQRAIDLAHSLSNETLRSWNVGEAGFCHRSMGRTELAIEQYEIALAIDRRLEHRSDESAVLRQLGTCFGQLGQTKRAIDLLLQSLRLSRLEPDRRRLCLTLCVLSELCMDAGRLEEAASHLEEATELVGAVRAVRLLMESSLAAARLAACRGQWLLVKNITEKARSYDYRRLAAWNEIMAGLALWRLGDPGDARQSFLQAEQHALGVSVDPDDFDSKNAALLAQAGVSACDGQDPELLMQSSTKIVAAHCADSGVLLRQRQLLKWLCPS